MSPDTFSAFSHSTEAMTEVAMSKISNLKHTADEFSKKASSVLADLDIQTRYVKTLLDTYENSTSADPRENEEKEKLLKQCKEFQIFAKKVEKAIHDYDGWLEKFNRF